MHRRAFLLGAGAAGLAACAAPERHLLDDREPAELPLGPAPTTTSSTSTTTTASPIEVVSDLPVSVPEEDLPGLSFVARARPEVTTVVVDEVLGSGDARWSFANPIESGGTLVFLIDEFDGLDNYRVLLPTRPNGSLGWIDADDVDIDRHNIAIRVELDAFRLTVLDHENAIFTAQVGVARDNAPTPLGRYYLTELLAPLDQSGPYGPYAYGLSGFSETFTTFNGGPGQLGIHGTDEPATLGTTVSSGCIRLHNDDITHIVEEIKVPTGAPVEVI